MKRWLWMTGGLVVWAVHFTALYTLSSAADVIVGADDFRWRMAGLALGVVCVGLCAALALQAARARTERDETRDFGRDLALLSAVVGGIAVAWQTLPTVIGW